MWFLSDIIFLLFRSDSSVCDYFHRLKQISLEMNALEPTDDAVAVVKPVSYGINKVFFAFVVVFSLKFYQSFAHFIVSTSTFLDFISLKRDILWISTVKNEHFFFVIWVFRNFLEFASSVIAHAFYCIALIHCIKVLSRRLRMRQNHEMCQNV